MRISRFHFHPVVASAGNDKKVVRWNTLACLAATVGQFARGLPNLVIDQQFRNALLHFLEHLTLGVGAHTSP